MRLLQRALFSLAGVSLFPGDLLAQEAGGSSSVDPKVIEACREEGAAEELTGSDLNDYVKSCVRDLTGLEVSNTVDMKQN